MIKYIGFFKNSNKYIIKKWGFIMAKPSPSRSDLKYLFKPTVSLSKAERKKKKRGFALAAGLLLALV